MYKSDMMLLLLALALWGANRPPKAEKSSQQAAMFFSQCTASHLRSLKKSAKLDLPRGNTPGAAETTIHGHFAAAEWWKTGTNNALISSTQARHMIAQGESGSR
jgi:hypothetical protein